MAKPNKESQKTTRERAAAARAKAEAEHRRRDNRNRLIGGVIVVALIGLIFGGVWFARKDSTSSTVSPDAAAALPSGVDEATYGVPFGTGSADVPQLQLWEDFQCPACKSLEDANGAGITGMADAGTIRLLWRPTTFLDVNLRNDASARATAAWGCAIDAGKAEEYHNTIFANQPEREGDGYTDEQLLAFGGDAGITGADFDTFSTCVADKTYAGWTANSYQAFQDDAVPGTPAGFLVLGDKKQEIPTETLADQATFEQAVKDFQASS